MCFIEAAKALVDAGYTVTVCRDRPVMDEALTSVVAEIEEFQCPEVMIDGWSTRMPVVQYSRAFRRLRRLVRRLRPAVIYANGGLPCQTAVPVGRSTGTPVLCHYHHPATTRYYYLWLLKYADHRIYPSEYTRSHVRSRLGVDGDVVFNGVDTEVYRPQHRRNLRTLRDRLGIPRDAVVVGQVGALVAHKQPDMVIRSFAQAAAQMSALYLCLVGAGPLEASLRALVRALGLEQRVVFAGYVDSTLPYYQEVIDIAVLASHTEGLGISILESSSCGLPAVIADGSGLRETVRPGETGLIFPPDDEGTLAKLLLELAADPDRRHAMGMAGRHWVVERFSLEQYRFRVVAAVDQTSKRMRTRR